VGPALVQALRPAQNLRRGDRHVFVVHFAGIRAVVPELMHGAGAETGAPGLRQKCGDAVVAAGPCAGHGHHPVADAGAGDEQLLSVDAVHKPVEMAPGAQVRRVRAGVGLGQGEAELQFSPGQPGQEPLLLRHIPVRAYDLVAIQADVPHHPGQHGQAPGEFLIERHGVQDVAPGPAILRCDGHAHEPEPTQLGQQVVGVEILRINAAYQIQGDLLLHECLHVLPKRLARGILQVQSHRPPPSKGESFHKSQTPPNQKTNLVFRFYHVEIRPVKRKPQRFRNMCQVCS